MATSATAKLSSIDRLLVLWPFTAVATGAVLLWGFGLPTGGAIAYGLLAGGAVALTWAFATVPFNRLADGLKTYEIAASPAPREYHLDSIRIYGETYGHLTRTQIWIAAIPK